MGHQKVRVMLPVSGSTIIRNKSCGFDQKLTELRGSSAHLRRNPSYNGHLAQSRLGKPHSWLGFLTRLYIGEFSTENFLLKGPMARDFTTSTSVPHHNNGGLRLRRIYSSR